MDMAYQLPFRDWLELDKGAVPVTTIVEPIDAVSGERS